ncbi:MAG: hypothetical protein HYV47_02485 [Candidatus Nealsonbacteria bacterium]|nr:hypothetical protein [Candidatus Nealsonbacteria bacterium]
MIFLNFKLNRAKDGFFKLLRRAAENFFLTFLILVFFALIVGLVIFYKYSILPSKMEPELGEEVIKFDNDSYQKILQEWQNREGRFNAAKTKLYSDPFRP